MEKRELIIVIFLNHTYITISKYYLIFWMSHHDIFQHELTFTCNKNVDFCNAEDRLQSCHLLYNTESFKSWMNKSKGNISVNIKPQRDSFEYESCVFCVSVWMNGIDARFRLLHVRMCFICHLTIWGHKHMNVSPELLWESLQEHFTVSFKKNYPHFTYTQNLKVFKASRQKKS